MTVYKSRPPMVCCQNGMLPFFPRDSLPRASRCPRPAARLSPPRGPRRRRRWFRRRSVRHVVGARRVGPTSQLFACRTATGRMENALLLPCLTCCLRVLCSLQPWALVPRGLLQRLQKGAGERLQGYGVALHHDERPRSPDRHPPSLDVRAATAALPRRHGMAVVHQKLSQPRNAPLLRHVLERRRCGPPVEGVEPPQVQHKGEE